MTQVEGGVGKGNEIQDWCGLNRDDILELVFSINQLGHTLEEGDWDKERWKLLTGDLENLKKLADKADPKCSCPPHGLFTPKERYVIMKNCIDKKNSVCAIKNLYNLGICILGDIG